jgi:hypothetical protein
MLDSKLIARIEDLPYWSSTPMQFSFTQSATITLGQYPFTAARASMEGEKNLTDNSLIYIRSISFSADIPILDYQQALQLVGGSTDIPAFYMFLQSDANAPTLRDPIKLLNYFDNQDYKMLIEPKKLPNRLTAFFRGTLQQTGALAGITDINLNIDIYAQEIIDDNFVAAIKAGYPALCENGFMGGR